MKQMIWIMVVMIMMSELAISQFKEQVERKPDIYQSITQSGRVSRWGLFDLSNLTMRHSFAISYLSIGGKGIMINSYTNSISYRLTDNLNLQADISLINTPFGSLDRKFLNSLNGIYINRLELNYQPRTNVLINIQYRQVPSFFYESYPYYGW